MRFYIGVQEMGTLDCYLVSKRTKCVIFSPRSSFLTQLLFTPSLSPCNGTPRVAASKDGTKLAPARKALARAQHPTQTARVPYVTRRYLLLEIRDSLALGVRPAAHFDRAARPGRSNSAGEVTLPWLEVARRRTWALAGAWA